MDLLPFICPSGRPPIPIPALAEPDLGTPWLASSAGGGPTAPAKDIWATLRLMGESAAEDEDALGGGEESRSRRRVWYAKIEGEEDMPRGGVESDIACRDVLLAVLYEGECEVGGRGYLGDLPFNYDAQHLPALGPCSVTDMSPYVCPSARNDEVVKDLACVSSTRLLLRHRLLLSRHVT